jgi:hypothetical protein
MKMRFTTSVVVVSGLVLAASVAEAQVPQAVPIVGSPAASQPPAVQPPSVQPPTVQPPPMPAGAAFTPPSTPPSIPAAMPQAGAARGPRKLDLTFKDGTVGLDAQNVTLREILTEWQRRGGCQFVNADKITGGPVTRQFPPGTPELQAIDSLLRDLASPNAGYGYMIGPPSTERAQNQSFCGAVYILPMSRPSASPAFTSSAGSPMAAPLVTPGSPDDEIPPVQAFPPPMPPQPRPNPQVPGQPDPGTPNTPPPAQTPGFGPVAPSATMPGQRPAAQPPGGAGRGNPTP